MNQVGEGSGGLGMRPALPPDLLPHPEALSYPCGAKVADAPELLCREGKRLQCLTGHHSDSQHAGTR